MGTFLDTRVTPHFLLPLFCLTLLLGNCAVLSICTGNVVRKNLCGLYRYGLYTLYMPHYLLCLYMQATGGWRVQAAPETLY